MLDFDTPSSLPYELPDFANVEVSELVPAFFTAVDDHAAEVAAIAANPEEPTWENTVEALEASGRMLDRVLAVIFNYAGTMATPEIRDVEEAVSPPLAKHFSELYLNEALGARIKQVDENTQIEEGSEEAALMAYWRRKFRRGGAELAPEQRDELKQIDERLAELSTRFGRVLQEQTEASAVLITEESELAGLSEATREVLATDAKEAGEEGWLIRIGLPSVQPILESLENPEVRRRVYEASLQRAGTANDETLKEIARLRARAPSCWAMPPTLTSWRRGNCRPVEAVKGLLNQVIPAAVSNAHGEYKRLLDKQAVSTSATGEENPELTGADWAYWSAQLKQEELSVDEEELRSYFPLDQVLVDGAFYAAQRLYGIEVIRRADLEGYHPEALVWEAREGADSSYPGATPVRASA